MLRVPYPKHIPTPAYPPLLLPFQTPLQQLPQFHSKLQRLALVNAIHHWELLPESDDSRLETKTEDGDIDMVGWI